MGRKKFYSTETEIIDKQKIQGLGDWLEQKVTEPLGIKPVVEAVTKAFGIKDCGCNKRKQILNDLVPFKEE